MDGWDIGVRRQAVMQLAAENAKDKGTGLKNPNTVGAVYGLILRLLTGM
jgi:hypothetical protein